MKKSTEVETSWVSIPYRVTTNEIETFYSHKSSYTNPNIYFIRNK